MRRGVQSSRRPLKLPAAPTRLRARLKFPGPIRRPHPISTKTTNNQQQRRDPHGRQKYSSIWNLPFASYRRKRGGQIAAGPIVAALAGAGAGGVVGGITGALVGMGIPEYEAKRYEGRVKEGGILLSVHCDDSKWVKRAKEILKETGAEDVSSTGETKG